MERSAGAEASAAVGGAGAHAGAGAEGSMHSASAGAAPLPARQTTITWPVLGGKGDGAPRILDRRAGTRRVDLGRSAHPPGAAAMAPGTSRPHVKAATKAGNCEGAPGRISTSAGGGCLGPGGGSGPRRSRSKYQRRSCTQRGNRSRGRTTRRRRDGDAIGPQGASISLPSLRPQQRLPPQPQPRYMPRTLWPPHLPLPPQPPQHTCYPC